MQIQSRKQMRYIYNKSSFIIMSGSMWWHSCPHVCVVTKQVDGSLDPSWPETCYDLYQLPPQPASRQWKQRARHDVHIFQEKSQPMVEVNEHTLSLFCSLSLSHTHTHTQTHTRQVFFAAWQHLIYISTSLVTDHLTPVKLTINEALSVLLEICQYLQLSVLY